jgi:hypothetical protein
MTLFESATPIGRKFKYKSPNIKQISAKSTTKLTITTGTPKNLGVPVVIALFK